MPLVDRTYHQITRKRTLRGRGSQAQEKGPNSSEPDLVNFLARWAGWGTNQNIEASRQEYRSDDLIVSVAAMSPHRNILMDSSLDVHLSRD